MGDDGCCKDFFFLKTRRSDDVIALDIGGQKIFSHLHAGVPKHAPWP